MERLSGLITAIRDELAGLETSVPLLVKLAPDLCDADIDAVGKFALDASLAGLVATNSTVARPGLSAPVARQAQPGGLSGAPRAPRSLAVLRRLRTVTQGRLPLISAGGVMDAADVLDRICAGATLVQSYTGFVLGGPLWPHRVNRELAERVSTAGAREVGELVGAAAPLG